MRRRPSRNRLRVLAHVPRYPPTVNSGAEWSIHTVLTLLAERGHQVSVLAGAAPDLGTYQGVPILDDSQKESTDDQYRTADVVLSQLEYAGRVARLAARHGLASVYFSRGPCQGPSFGHFDLLVHNSHWIHDIEKAFISCKCTVFEPPIVPHLYATTPGSAITLVNASREKGADTFYAIARRLPERTFLAVSGGHRQQIPPRGQLPNVEFLPNTDDMKAVYSRTRVVLMPSETEPFGRVAIEAGLSGIPTIAHPCPGIVEALGDAGLFAHRDDVDTWVRLIEYLDDPATYQRYGMRAYRRAQELDPASRIEELEESLWSVVGHGYRRLPVSVAR